MIHISEMSADKRINHPQEVVKLGQLVKAQVLAIDIEKRQLRLSMKQLVPSGLDEYIAEHKEGDAVTGRIIEVSGERARVELGEGIQANCQMKAARPTLANNTQAESPSSSAASNTKPDLSALGSMLQARWKAGKPASGAAADAVSAGQIRKFKIATLDPAAKKIELELA